MQVVHRRLQRLLNAFQLPALQRFTVHSRRYTALGLCGPPYNSRPPRLSTYVRDARLTLECLPKILDNR
jgi:hypothetical protein